MTKESNRRLVDGCILIVGIIVVLIVTACIKGNIFSEDLKLQDDVNIEGEKVSWDFDDEKLGSDGWVPGGIWAYTGSIDLTYVKEIGNGALKINADFTNDIVECWSEIKIKYDFKQELDSKKYNLLTYDFIFNPEFMTNGTFKTKVLSGEVIEEIGDIDISECEDVGNGFKKSTVAIRLNSEQGYINQLSLSVIGNYTNYKGDIYIDNINLLYKESENIYVEITEKVKEQNKIDINKMKLMNNIKLVDSKAIEETKSLYSYLKIIANTDKVIYGHQNDTHHKGGKYKAIDSKVTVNSDTLDITGSIAGVVGMDTLSLTGDELQGGVKVAAKVAIEAYNQGAIITLSSHMPNFQSVRDKGIDSNGRYDYSEYTSTITEGNIVSRIMPEGDLNNVFIGYLDLIAEYAEILQDKGIPVLFRPFHENNGSWFWWGEPYCEKQEYKELFAYTIEYLKDIKEIHNFIYVYSPNGPFEDEEEYLERYPGDEYIDILGFDMYHDNPTKNDKWMNKLSETIEVVQEIAEDKGKICVLSEVGMRFGEGGIKPWGNTRTDWYNEVLDVVSGSKIPYFMVWSNFDDTENFFSPYRVTEKTGHEMINEFISFYNDERSIFANELGNYSELK